MPTHEAPRRFSPMALIRQLAWLRLFAVAGQVVAVAIAVRLLHLAVPTQALALEIATLAAFAALVFWRLRLDVAAGELEAVGHIAVDTLLFALALHLTGGAANPFINLLLLPVALGAAALSWRGTVAVVAIVALAYLVLLSPYRPLAGAATHADHVFREHVIGMAVNFMLAAALLAFFIGRLSAALRAQQDVVRRVRERALRGEGILAVATQAAGTAHELNTPLASMRLLLGELRREHADESVLDADLALLESQVDRCSGILHDMAVFGREQLAQAPEHTRLGKLLDDALDRLRLLRPQVEVACRVDADDAALQLRVPAGLRHAVLNLLDNAADASAQRGSNAVRLGARRDGGWLELRVGDDGPGFGRNGPLRFGESDKHDGLGLGLALAEATAERLGGDMHATDDARGGEIRLRLPLSALA